MALIFNSGNISEVYVAQFASGSYRLGSNVSNWESSYWLNDQLYPYNIIPIVNEFLADSSKNWVPVAQYTGNILGFKISQLNDVITVNWTVRTGGTDADNLITTFPAGSVPGTYNLYFLYLNDPSDADRSRMAIFKQTDLFEHIYVAPAVKDGHDYLIGTVQGQSHQLDWYSFYPGLSPERPYSPGAVSNTSSYFSSVPDQQWKWNFNHIYNNLFVGDNLSGLKNADGTDPVVPDPVVPFPPSDDLPYNPQMDDTSDQIDIPSDPVIGVTSAGFINVYKPGLNDLQGLGDILFPNVANATDVLDAIIKLCETLQNQNLINYVIDCHIIPVQPTVGATAHIKVGYRDTGISVPKVSSDYVNVSCGSLTLPEYFGGFADYITNCKIYLPFVGFVDTLPEYWQAGTIAIDYKFNIIDGSFMAYIRSTSSKSNLSGSVIAQYSGNACMHLPVTGVNYANMVSGIIGAAVSLPSSKTPAAVVGTAMSAANSMLSGGDIQQSNGYNSTSAILGVRYPYLLIERPVPAYPTNYRHDKGYPSNITTMLGNIHGFTIISDIDLSGIPFTSDELHELRQLLEEGVYF